MKDNKPKLSVSQQIDYMRQEKGIKFEYISEEDAAAFLTYNTYYFKIKAYAKNYEKYANGDMQDKYINLDFACLKELSTLDSIFRKIILKLCLDVEHFLKVKLCAHIAENENEDGYKIVEKFVKSCNPNLYEEIDNKSGNSYCANLVNKYKNKWAIWNIVEVMSFGDFIELYAYYFSFYNKTYEFKNMLFPIKCLRNAAAHNNCLLCNLKYNSETEISPHRKIMQFVSNIDGIKTKTREKKMTIRTIHDFIVLLYVFCKLTEHSDARKYALKELKEFVDVRCLKHKEYFKNNEVLKSFYVFLKKILDFFYNETYN